MHFSLTQITRATTFFLGRHRHSQRQMKVRPFVVAHFTAGTRDYAATRGKNAAKRLQPILPRFLHDVTPSWTGHRRETHHRPVNSCPDPRSAWTSSRSGTGAARESTWCNFRAMLEEEELRQHGGRTASLFSIDLWRIIPRCASRDAPRGVPRGSSRGSPRVSSPGGPRGERTERTSRQQEAEFSQRPVAVGTERDGDSRLRAPRFAVGRAETVSRRETRRFRLSSAPEIRPERAKSRANRGTIAPRSRTGDARRELIGD